MRLLTKENGKIDQNFLYREVEARARPGAQVEWMQDDCIEQGKARTFEVTRPAPHTILGYRPLPVCVTKLLSIHETH